MDPGGVERVTTFSISTVKPDP
jgi:hypothetical protein